MGKIEERANARGNSKGSATRPSMSASVKQKAWRVPTLLVPVGGWEGGTSYDRCSG